VRIGVLDVGSNTTRLLVASVEHGQVVRLARDKVRLSLGEEIERYGVVSDVHVVAAAKAVRKLAAVARKQGIESLDVFVTAPGRQSGNAKQLVAALTRAAGVPVRVLSTEEEGRLAYGGAVATAPMPLPDRIAVCDVGGASTEIAVGSPGAVPGWVCSVDLGSVRLTTRLDSDRFGEDELGDACAETGVAFAGVEPPRVAAALAVGGSARAARRLVGATLGADELAEALHLVRTNPPRTISRRFRTDRARARILPAGLVILAEVQRRLGVPLHVCDGGIREGAVLAWVAEAAA
jgi:exopolyphosphatase / guanosine-5'-triphosphate,3'-diphosphate pyrophosphatase